MRCSKLERGGVLKGLSILASLEHQVALDRFLRRTNITASDCRVVRSVQSQADSGLPARRILVAFRRVNHTFLYLYPRDT